MSSPNENWYSHLVAQSRTDAIYTLIHSYLTPEWEPNHDLDFVVVRRGSLPDGLKDIPPKHFSKKLKTEQYCFPGNDYVLLHNYQLTDYLHHAQWAAVVEDFEGREFIELRYNWTEEAEDLMRYPPAYYKDRPPRRTKPVDMPILKQAPQSPREAALLQAYDLLQKGEQKLLASYLAEAGHRFLDEQQIPVGENSAEVLHMVARRMMGYNIVAMVYAWNGFINKAAEVDALYIHHPPLWDYLQDYIEPYLELLMAKGQRDYLQHLFGDADFRRRFLSHYEAFVSLFINDRYELTRMGDVVNIINRVNHSVYR